MKQTKLHLLVVIGLFSLLFVVHGCEGSAKSIVPQFTHTWDCEDETNPFTKPASECTSGQYAFLKTAKHTKGIQGGSVERVIKDTTRANVCFHEKVSIIVDDGCGAAPREENSVIERIPCEKDVSPIPPVKEN
ncbi:MAG: hypothetical protein AAB879_01980 [Patescibacteria group bacterium]